MSEIVIVRMALALAVIHPQTMQGTVMKDFQTRRKIMNQTEMKGAEYDFYGKLPLSKAIPLGLQHVLAMFVGNLTPLLIITAACGIGAGSDYADVQVALLQNAMLVAGIVTLVQLYAIGPVGGKVPIIMGTSSGFIGVCSSVSSVMGGGVLAYGAIMCACIIGGLFEGVLGFMLKPLRKFFPPVVTGSVVLSIGLSLISVGVNSFGGGSSANDFGSLENLLLGAVVLIVIVALKHGTKGITSASSILIGIIVGYIVAAIMGMVLPTTAVNADGVEYTKAWVLNWDKVKSASWFALPAFLPIKPVFDLRAVLPFLIMFIVTAVETIGDISGVMEGGMGREATDSELSGGVICDGLGSSFAALFGVLPNTSFSQNVGLVTITKIVNRSALATGAIFLILCGLFPKLAALISIMPQSVLGGAAVMMFSSIVVSGIQLVTKNPITARNITILSVALGLGYGLGSNSSILTHLPQAIQLIFGGSGIVPAAIVAIVLNIVLPRSEDDVA
jgi:uracil-xanthine permease